MYSPEITQAPVTLFLGAGASKPLGKMLMTEFINSLALDKRFNSSPLYLQIIQEKPDLEYLFEQLEQWQEKRYAERKPNINIPTLSYVPPVGIVNHVQELLLALREKVFAAYRDIDAPNRINTVRIFNELLDGIFNDLQQSRCPLVVFTTNYDSAVEIYCEESKSYVLEDGFHEEGGAFVWRRESFDDYKVGASKKHVVLFKLHGSARWVRRDGRILKLPFPIYAGQEREFENVYWEVRISSVLPPKAPTAISNEQPITGKKSLAKSYLSRLFAPENLPNIGLFVAGIAGIVVAIRTLKAIESQTLVLVEGQRPRIVAVANDDPSKTFSDPLARRVVLEVTNKGAMPATDYRYESWIEVLPDTSGNFTGAADHFKSDVPSVLYPDSPQVINIPLRGGISQEEFAEVRKLRKCAFMSNMHTHSLPIDAATPILDSTLFPRV